MAAALLQCVLESVYKHSVGYAEANGSIKRLLEMLSSDVVVITN